MPSFDWRTEADRPGGNLPAPIHRDPPPHERPLWLRIGTLALILSMTAFFIYQRVNQLIDTAVAEAKASPLAALDLLQQAAGRGDEELFTLLLSRQQSDWLAGQQALFAQNLLFDRRPLGLAVVADDPHVIDVALSPDLSAATITFELAYAVLQEIDGAPPVTLQQSARFQVEKQRWVLAPAGAEFWGGRVQVEGQRVTVIVPERDAALGKRLALDLDNQLATMCATLTGLNCPADLHLRLRMENSPAGLLQMAERPALTSGRDMNLPTPSLVGRPVDEAGYQALFRGYAAHVVSGVITELTGQPCCPDSLFYQALLDKQLSQLGLRAWPLTPADYDTMLSRYFRLSPIQAAWGVVVPASLTSEDVWRIYTFVEFLAESSPDLPLAEMQRRLADSASYLTWARQFRPGNDATLKRDWMRFVYDQTTAAQLAPPIPLPEHQVRLYCLSGAHHELYQYDWDADNWTGQHSLDAAIDGLISPLPGKDGLILYEHGSAITNQMWSIVRPDEAAVVLPVDLDPVFYPANSSADSVQQLVLTGQYNPQQDRFQFTLLDLAQCDLIHCELIPLDGLPVWSPDGAHSVVSLTHDRGGLFQLALGDGAGKPFTPLGSGSNPFWIDNETYGYLRTGREQTEVVVRALHSGETLLQLTTADLLTALLPEQEATALSIRQVWGHPANPHLLFIDAAAPALQTHYIFSVAWPAPQVSVVLQLDDRSSFIDFHFAPDGRWWSLTTYNRSDPVGAAWSVYLHDIGADETTFLAFNPIPYPAYSTDWSADGRWFLKVEDGVITLVAPDHDYYKLLFFDASLCTSAVLVHHRPDKSRSDTIGVVAGR